MDLPRSSRMAEAEAGPLSSGDLAAIEAACLSLPAFAETHPDRQPDAE